MKSTQPLLVLIGLHDFLIFSNRMAHVWGVESGNICSVSVFFVRVGKKDSNIPSPGRTRSIKCPTPGPTKTNPHPPPGLTIIGALTESKMNKTKKGKINKIWMRKMSAEMCQTIAIVTVMFCLNYVKHMPWRRIEQWLELFKMPIINIVHEHFNSLFYN